MTGRFKYCKRAIIQDNAQAGNDVWDRKNAGGNKKIDSQGRRWGDCVKEDMKERGISESEAWDRGEWRRKISTCIPNEIGI